MNRALAALLVTSLATLPAQDIVDLAWRETEAGLLQVRVGEPPSGSAGEDPRPPAEWRTMFPGLFAAWDGTPSILDGVRNAPPFDAIALLLHGPGGAAAIDEWRRRLDKLGVRVSMDLAEMRRIEPDPRIDPLRVRHLQSVGTHAAVRGLVAYSLDPARDPFTRAAAAEAVAQSGMQTLVPDAPRAVAHRVDRWGTAGLQAALARLPDDCDLVLGLHCAALPSPAPLLADWRRLQHLLLSTTVADQGEATSPAEFLSAQLRMDQPGQLPCELAARFGNWRVDHALFAVRSATDDSCWFHLAGVFQPQRIASGLRGAGIDAVSIEDGEVRASLDGWHLRSTPLEFEAWQGDLTDVKRGSRRAGWIHRADDRATPIWAVVGARSRLSEWMGLGQAELEVRYDAENGTLSAVADAGGNAAATALCERWRDWQKARSLETDWGYPNMFSATWHEIGATPAGLQEYGKIALAWLRCVGAIVARVDGTRVTWTFDVSKLPTLDLVRLLKVDPRPLLEIARP